MDMNRGALFNPIQCPESLLENACHSLCSELALTLEPAAGFGVTVILVVVGVQEVC